MKPTPTGSLKQAKREIQAVNAALKAGYPPVSLAGSTISMSAVRKAGDHLGVDRRTFRDRIGTPAKPGRWWKLHKIKPDWSLYKEAPTEGVELDAIESRRARDNVTLLQARLAEAERRTADAEDIRKGVLGLVGTPLQPRLIPPSRDKHVGNGRTVILHLSDIHYGETVALDEMDGVNSYGAKIGQNRLDRFFGKAASLMTKYWQGKPPEEIILCLGGDLISGDIHEELAQTNYPLVPATVRQIGEHIAGGIIELRKKVKCPVRVYSVPGNHGRLTRKPQSKHRAGNSLDILATDFAEATVKGQIDRVQFYQTHSPDSYFSTYAWNWLLTHGDTMGSKGGQGFIGSAATIIRGHRKLMDTSWRSGRAIHHVLTAHLHTTLESSFGWANGSVVGYSEYARDLRADPEPARQNMLVVHPLHGIVSFNKLYLGHPNEGSHYNGATAIIRPTEREL